MATSVPPVAPAATEPLDYAKLASQVARLIGKNDGDPSKALELVMTENANYRDRHRADTDKIKDLERQLKEVGDKAPGKDDVVLKGDEAKAYTALAALKVTPDEVTQLRQFKTGEEHKAKIKVIGEAAKMDPDILSEVLTMKGMTALMVDVMVPDEKDKTKIVKKAVPHVRPITDEKAEPKPLEEYITTHCKVFEPALRKVAGGSGGHTSGGRSDGVFTPFPAQSNAQESKVTTGAPDVVKSVGDSMGFAPPSDFTKKKE